MLRWQHHRVEFKDKGCSSMCILSRQYLLINSGCPKMIDCHLESELKVHTKELPRDDRSPSANLCICVWPCSLASLLGFEYGDHYVEALTICIDVRYGNQNHTGLPSRQRVSVRQVKQMDAFTYFPKMQKLKFNEFCFETMDFHLASNTKRCLLWFDYMYRHPASKIKAAELLRDDISPSDEERETMGLSTRIDVQQARANIDFQNQRLG
ncbi:hypothetical protein ARMGADRAFT_1034305 [Armillaria gallica]|uniref:Uncharacterized protein n=1 Tax=Armillaria gallica TaxID=47427 RepID=A0A2H3DAW5_ARMGA|nr:hypothetical protein ARMGADRAFT_1034305 [Armillaria gallica]